MAPAMLRRLAATKFTGSLKAWTNMEKRDAHTNEPSSQPRETRSRNGCANQSSIHYFAHHLAVLLLPGHARLLLNGAA